MVNSLRGKDQMLFETAAGLARKVRKDFRGDMLQGLNDMDLKKRRKKVKSLSHVWLFVTPWTVAYQAPPSMGFSRQQYRSGLLFPSPGHLPDSGIEHGSPAFQADPLTSEPPGKPCFREVHTVSVLYCAHYCMKCSLGISNSLEKISSLSHSIVFLYFCALFT